MFYDLRIMGRIAAGDNVFYREREGGDILDRGEIPAEMRNADGLDHHLWRWERNHGLHGEGVKTGYPGHADAPFQLDAYNRANQLGSNGFRVNDSEGDAQGDEVRDDEREFWRVGQVTGDLKQ